MAQKIDLKIDLAPAQEIRRVEVSNAGSNPGSARGLGSSVPDLRKGDSSARLRIPVEGVDYKKPNSRAPSIRGQPVSEGSLGYETMCDMLTGIRVTCSVRDFRSIKIQQADFEFRRNLTFPKKGSRTTPPHSQRDFKFTDYSPVVFARIREKFGIDPGDYLDSLTRELKLTCTRSPGKSGSVFFYSSDGRFMVKTITKEEAHFLRELLPAYYEHITTNPDTHLMRFFGLHQVKPKKERREYIVVMHNILASAYFDMDEIYDLKGSTVGRTTEETEPSPSTNGVRAKKPGVIYKDLDFARGLCLGPAKAQQFNAQLQRDAMFLAESNVMDYSLLVGVHELTEEDLHSHPYRSDAPITPRRSASQASHVPLIEYVSRFTHDWGGFCATDEHNRPGVTIYFVGIIDILQQYNLRKQVEHMAKSIKYDGDQISAVNPKHYADRFLKYLRGQISSLPSTDRTLADLQQALAAQHDGDESAFGMLTPRGQRRLMGLESPRNTPATRGTTDEFPFNMPRLAAATEPEPTDDSSDDSSFSSSSDASSKLHSSSPGAMTVAVLNRRHHTKRSASNSSTTSNSSQSKSESPTTTQKADNPLQS